MLMVAFSDTTDITKGEALLFFKKNYILEDMYQLLSVNRGGTIDIFGRIYQYSIHSSEKQLLSNIGSKKNQSRTQT